MTGWHHNRFDILLVRYMVMENEGNGSRHDKRTLDALGELGLKGCRFRKWNLKRLLPRSQFSNIYESQIRVDWVSP